MTEIRVVNVCTACQGTKRGPKGNACKECKGSGRREDQIPIEQFAAQVSAILKERDAKPHR